MLVPRFVYGLTRDVKKESLRRLRLFKKGATWTEAMADDLVDIDTLPGTITLSYSITTVYQPFVHIHAPFQWALDAMYKKTLPKTALSTIFFDAVKSPWGVLGMLGDSTGRWMKHEAHHWPYVQAVERWWDEFEGVGDRYEWACGLTRPIRWRAGAAYYAIHSLGLSREDLHALMPQGFHALYRRLLEVRAAQGLPPPE